MKTNMRRSRGQYAVRRKRAGRRRLSADHDQKQRPEFNHGYNTGYNEGYNGGYNEGFNVGFNEGYSQGHEQGFQLGSAAGQESGKLQASEMFEQESERRLNEEYRRGFEEGTRSSYDRGFTEASRIFFDKGMYAGGEEKVENVLGAEFILPHRTLDELIAAGIERYVSERIRLLSSAEISQELKNALDHKYPLSVVRLGDGELLTLSQERVLSMEEVKNRGHFLPYAGVHVPDLSARDVLAEAIGRASIVGVPLKRMSNFQPLLIPALRASGIESGSLKMTYSTINYSLYYDGHLLSLLAGRKVLIIGNLAESMAALAKQCGIRTVSPISSVSGMADVSRVVAEAGQMDFDVALVCAGVAAVPIAEQIASRYGRVAVDFGHMADVIVNQGRW